MASFCHMHSLHNFILGGLQLIHPMPHSPHQTWDTAIHFASSPLQNLAKAALITLPKPDFNPQPQQQGKACPMFPSWPYKFKLVLGVDMEHSLPFYFGNQSCNTKQVTVIRIQSLHSSYFFPLPKSPRPPQGSSPWRPDAHQMRTLKILIGRCKLLNKIQ